MTKPLKVSKKDKLKSDRLALEELAAGDETRVDDKYKGHKSPVKTNIGDLLKVQK